jgi:hypothetical protein
MSTESAQHGALYALRGAASIAGNRSRGNPGFPRQLLEGHMSPLLLLLDQAPHDLALGGVRARLWGSGGFLWRWPTFFRYGQFGRLGWPVRGFSCRVTHSLREGPSALAGLITWSFGCHRLRPILTSSIYIFQLLV